MTYFDAQSIFFEIFLDNYNIQLIKTNYHLLNRGFYYVVSNKQMSRLYSLLCQSIGQPQVTNKIRIRIYIQSSLKELPDRWLIIQSSHLI